jgi:methionyl-tRNA formyltransferase
MRVVVLSETPGYAGRALLQLGLRGVTPSALVVAPKPMLSVVAQTTAAIRARSPRRVAGTALRRLAAILDPPSRFLVTAQFEGLAERVVSTGGLNSPGMLRVLEELTPDVLVLVATGLVDEAVLGVPRVATLNSHPGLLPWIRGNGAVDQAIRRRVPVGVSVHHVDKGADTGDVLVRQLIPVTKADTANSLRQKADELRWMLLADVVRQFASGEIPRRVPQGRRFSSCRWPTSTERAEAERLVTDGEAYRRYCAWREIVGGDTLPESDAIFEASLYHFT